MPAEDTLTYKVEIDPSDLGAQLDQIRSQVDLAMGSFAFSQAAAPAGLDLGMGGGAGEFISQAGQGFAATSQEFMQSDATSLGGMLNHNYEAFKLGYSKFTTGLERMGAMVPPSPLVNFSQSGLTDFTRQMEAMQSVGRPGGQLFSATALQSTDMPGLIPGALGFGYDPDKMSMSRFEFNEQYADAMGKRARGLLEDNALGLAGTAAGAAIGAAGGPIGAGVGAIIGMAGDMTMGWLGAQRRQEEQVGEALGLITDQTFMKDPMTAKEGTAMAGRLLGVADTYDSRVTKLTRDDIQSQLLEFTESGGFDAVRSADEFETTAKGLIENTRKVMRSLKMTQEEAIGFMADMQREGFSSTGDAGMLAMEVSTNAKANGMDSMELMNFMRQGSEMFRGSGIGMAGGMQMLQEARTTTQQLIQGPGRGLDVVRELGGADNAAAGLAQSQANFMQSAMGIVGFNNLQKGGATND